jgi:hypothetical protein
MGKVFEALDDELTAFITAQRVFFVATAPSGDGGHVNLSPKGYDSFRVLDALTVAYLDLTGSGVETIAHLRQNGRITFLFCAFDGPPKLVRLYGTGSVSRPGDADFAALAARFPDHRGARAVIRVALERVSSSCGFSVPLMSFQGERDTLAKWAERKTDDELEAYRAQKNARSIDALAALDDADR